MVVVYNGKALNASMDKTLHQQVKDYAKMYHLPFDTAKITISKWFPPDMGKELARLKE